MKGYTKLIVDGTYRMILGIMSMPNYLNGTNDLCLYIWGENWTTLNIPYKEKGKIQSLFNGEDVKGESGTGIRLSWNLKKNFTEI